jgi:hypothetical protein
MNQIATTVPVQSNALTLADPAMPSLLNFVALAVRDPDIKIDKLEALLRMQREIIADDARLQFHRAMSAVQGEMQPVLRDATNTQTNSRYARLETIDAVMRPIYSRHGFSLSFNSEPVEGANIRIACEVAHSAGHSKMYHLEAALDTAGPQGKLNKTPLHGLGSSVSYLRRYLTCMIFHVVLANEDNDGNRQRNDTPDTPGFLTHSQCMDLKALMRETHTIEARFLAAMCPAAKVIAEAPATDFPRLKNALLTKLGVLRQRAAAATQAQNREART